MDDEGKQSSITTTVLYTGYCPAETVSGVKQRPWTTKRSNPASQRLSFIQDARRIPALRRRKRRESRPFRRQRPLSVAIFDAFCPAEAVSGVKQRLRTMKRSHLASQRLSFENHISSSEHDPGWSLLQWLYLYIALFFLLAIASVMLRVNRPAELCVASLLWISGHHTVYSDSFTETNFLKISVGMSSDDVIRLIGEPLSRSKWCAGQDGPLGDVWSYTGPSRPGGSYRLKEVLLMDGRVVKVQDGFYLD